MKKGNTLLDNTHNKSFYENFLQNFQSKIRPGLLVLKVQIVSYTSWVLACLLL